MNQRISVGAIIATISLLSNLGAGLINGSYKTGTQVAKIENKLENLSQDLKRRDEFLNYRIDQLKAEIDKKGGRK
ncbi:hypothetical protein [Brunnivagina elsteri]|uniref:Uncharacterized protein n=1 Tax=Brunnivagina elsteri CCALA 953 TaxID=987040 RepID=A0A2A2TLE8_9CYAN|nr:hypothetical protein [Calothrix elsteri]PAX58366.1 hypothetical protein CK510_07805 [Calothrix elsteri CCALA 953]